MTFHVDQFIEALL